jgi:NTP pyrophosphatase (non-canonical NTP hydrolase)
MSKTFKQLVDEALEAGKQFPNKWDLKTHYIDLVEEVGELGNAILIDSGSKSEKRRRAQLQDSFADILFQLIQTADEAGIDLEASLVQMLAGLQARQEKREYHDDK